MLASGLIGLVGGCLVGARSRVFALIPLQLFAIAICTGLAIAGRDSVASAAALALASCVGLQAGYVICFAANLVLATRGATPGEP